MAETTQAQKDAYFNVFKNIIDSKEALSKFAEWYKK